MIHELKSLAGACFGSAGPLSRRWAVAEGHAAEIRPLVPEGTFLTDLPQLLTSSFIPALQFEVDLLVKTCVPHHFGPC